jgi:hypothetical protein
MCPEPVQKPGDSKGDRYGRTRPAAFGDLDVTAERFRGQWQMGRQISVDYGRETDADIKQIEAALMSPQDKAADERPRT